MYKKLYLYSYCCVQLVGWLSLLPAIWKYFLDSKFSLWLATNVTLKIFQTAALLEIVHIILGLVKSRLLPTIVQNFSRIFTLWCICNNIPIVQTSVGYPIILCSWTIAEIVRYLYYIFKLDVNPPTSLTWSRYSFFLVLYPLGALGELLCMYYALSYIKHVRLYSFKLLFGIQFNYYYFIICFMLSYVPMFPLLYYYMLTQRRKVLGGNVKRN